MKPLGEIDLRGAREKADPNMVAVVVRVSPVPAKPEWTRIYVAEPVPAPPPETVKIINPEEEARQMAERRRTAR